MGTMSVAVLVLMLAVLRGVSAQSDWIAIRWDAASGPREVEYSRASVKTVAGVVSVSLRRDRAAALRQDSTIAPESNPWTTLNAEVDCARGRWRSTGFSATDSTGRLATVGASVPSQWLPIEHRTLVEALRSRLCPTT